MSAQPKHPDNRQAKDRDHGHGHAHDHSHAHEPDWEPPIPGRRRVLRTWDEYMAMAKRIIERFDHKFDLKHFDYHHPVRLQKVAPRFRKPYPVKIAYTDGRRPVEPDRIRWAAK